MQEDKVVDTVDKAMDIFSKVVDSISQMAPGLWDATVRHHYINAIMYLILVLFVTVCLGASSVIFYKLGMKNVELKKQHGDNSDEPGYFVCCGICTVLFCAFVCLFTFNASEKVATIFAPEHAAMMQLINSIK